MDLSEALAGLSELAAVGDDVFDEGDLLLSTITWRTVPTIVTCTR